MERFAHKISRQSSVPISAKDVLGADAENYIKQNIYFRIDLGCGRYSNNTLMLPVHLSAPHITSLTLTQPKCYGENTGAVKILFDRALKSNELLNIFIRDAIDTTKVIANRLNLTELEPSNTIAFEPKLASAIYDIKLIGKYPDSPTATYTEDIRHKAIFQVKSPAQIIFTATKQNDVRCFGGNDGAARINISGGTKSYRIAYRKNAADTFTTKTFLFASPGAITGLSAGTYTFRISDANDCFPKDGSGIEIKPTVQINQPAEATAIDLSEVTPPLAFGRKDGNIKVIIKGGTPKKDGSYNVIWKKLDGTILANVNNTTVATGYQTELQNIGAGKYIFNTTDSNFTTAANGTTQGCMLIDTFTVTEPPLLVVNLQEEKYISCKNDADGQLVAHATGGVTYRDRPLPYKYQWFKKEATDIDLNKTDSIATGLKTGDYYVVIEDRNLIKQTSPIFVLSEPDILSLQFSTQANSCQGDGSITAITTGGTTPYHVEWTTNETSDTTATINNQKEGDYYAKITDAHGCVIGSSVHLAIPQGIKIDSAITQTPSYYNSQDGAIQLTISGGNPPYTYRWGNGATTKDLQNITAGIYPITITDASGCTQTQTYTLQNPIRIIQTDGTPLPNGVTTKTLCNGQHIDIDATIPDNAAVYNWRSNNSFSANTAKVTLTNAGKYWVTITDSKGITASDTLIIKQNNTEIDASFVVSTQAFKGEKVTFVNISYPAPERISWLIPNNPKIETIQNNQNVAELIFKDTGTYTISMKAFVGACEKMITKKVIVIEGQQFD
ncbi:MAG TPA: SprB repeat-containing protein, partial [Chitinophagaceae bacterium]|nr:SprB repeat-containing protein [Chitinophagaceae bacterium]